MSVNKVILLGYVGSDPELRYPEKDRAIAYLSLATNELRGNTRTEGDRMALSGIWWAECNACRALCKERYTTICGRLS